jgi:hypothetical protein
MNASRLARLFREIADELDSSTSAPKRAAPPASRPRASRLPRPAGETDDVTRARARRALRDAGFVEGDK